MSTHRNWLQTCLRTLQGLVLLIGVSACTEAPQAQWQDYRERLARVLGVDLAGPDAGSAPAALPSVKTAAEFTEQTITLVELARLHPCGLDSLISERNSSLGKVMTAAVALDYELKLLDLLPACIALPELPTEFKQRLQAIRAEKLQQLPARFQAMLTTDQTLRAQLQGSKRGIDDMSGQSSTRQALQNLQSTAVLLRTFSQSHDVTQRPPAALLTQPWMQALSDLHQSQRLADLQHSVRQSLLEISSLNEALAAVPLTCPRGQRAVMDQVLQQIFIGRLQPMLAQTDQSITELTPLLLALYHGSPWHEVIRARYLEPKLQLQQQLKRHVSWWQSYQQRCAP